jgi:hypothetical protein
MSNLQRDGLYHQRTGSSPGVSNYFCLDLSSLQHLLFRINVLDHGGSVADPKQKFGIRPRIRIRHGVSFGSGFESGGTSA